MLLPRLANSGNHLRQSPEDLYERWIRRRYFQKPRELYSAEKVVHPEVVLGIFESAERLAKAEVAYDIEGKKVIPLAEIDSFARGGFVR